MTLIFIMPNIRVSAQAIFENLKGGEIMIISKEHRKDLAKAFLLTGQLLEEGLCPSTIQEIVQTMYPRHTDVGDAFAFELDDYLFRLDRKLDGEHMEFVGTDLYKERDK